MLRSSIFCPTQVSEVQSVRRRYTNRFPARAAKGGSLNEPNLRTIDVHASIVAAGPSHPSVERSAITPFGYSPLPPPTAPSNAPAPAPIAVCPALLLSLERPAGGALERSVLHVLQRQRHLYILLKGR